MLPQTDKFVMVTAPAAIIDNASLTTTEIDTYGADYARVFLVLGATDIAMTALKMQESDTSGSGMADITGLVYGTSTNIAGAVSALPGATDDNKCFCFEIDLRGRKRFLDLVATIGDGAAGAFAMAFALLERRDEETLAASDRGYGDILRVS